MKKWLITLVLLAALAVPAGAVPYQTYTYVNAADGVYAVEAPAAYVPAEILDSDSLGIELQAPEDLYCDRQGNF